jgi:hypothetical protein
MYNQHTYGKGWQKTCHHSLIKKESLTSTKPELKRKKCSTGLLSQHYKTQILSICGDPMAHFTLYELEKDRRWSGLAVEHARQIATCIIWGPKATIYSTSDLEYKDNNSRQIRTPRDLEQY